jgi:two-component system chemotaxis response regulator CheB
MEKNRLAARCGLLVIGGSAGSLEIIIHLLPLIRQDVSFPIVIVVHRRSDSDSMLTELFASKTLLPVKEAEEKEALCAGTIYLAPADYHLLVEKDGTLSLDFSEKVNYSRPSIDVTFETAAEAFGEALVSILLSGASSDGTKGMQHVKKHKGIVVVQDPKTAEAAYMPAQAIANVAVDLVIKIPQLADYINSL